MTIEQGKEVAGAKQESIVAATHEETPSVEPSPLNHIPPADLLATLKALDRKLRELQKEYSEGKLSKGDYDNRQLILRKKLRENELTINKKSREDRDWAKALRYKLYEDRTVQFLLSGFMSGMVSELIPNLDTDRRARYPILENIDGASAAINPTEILNELAYAGILEKRLFERFPTCPNCRSHSHVYLRFKCPECGSMDLDFGSLIEHFVCGTVHEFEQCISDDKLLCPSCKERLVEEGNDYRTVGTFNKCNTCRVHFEGPEQKFVCRNCSQEFHLREASFYETHTYALKKDLIHEAKGLVGLPVFKSTLEAIGYRVEFPGTVSGASGIPHSFTISATKNGRIVAVDIVESDSDVDEKEVLAFYAKVTDAKSVKGILVAVPGLSRRAKEFASTAMKENADYIEAKNIAEAVESLRSYLESDTKN